MIEKPGAKELSSASKAFIGDNWYYFKLYLMPLIVPLAAMEIVADIGQLYSPWFALFSITMVYLYACFALSWHRAVLLGLKPEHAVNPFALKPGEGKFVLAFLGIGMIPVLFGLAGGIPLGIFMAMQNNTMVIVCYVVAVVLVVYSIILTLRLAFVLPAKSVNAPITLKEAKQISQGLISKLFAASFWWMILIGVAFAVWVFIAGAMTALVFGFPVESVMTSTIFHENIATSAVYFLMVGLPKIFVNLYMIAFYVTILSKLYQWSLQNRHLTGGERKAEMLEEINAGEKKSLKI